MEIQIKRCVERKKVPNKISKPFHRMTFRTDLSHLLLLKIILRLLSDQNEVLLSKAVWQKSLQVQGGQGGPVFNPHQGFRRRRRW